jgi:hypothetical protein
MKLAVLTLLPLLASFASASTKSNPPQPLLKIADVSTSFDDEKLPTASDLRTVTGRCDWGHEDLLKSPYWGIELNPADLQEIKDALEVCKAPGSGLDLQDGWQPLGVTPENFPLKRLAKKLKKMADELENGTGAVMIKNMPVENYSVEDLGIIYAGVNSYIGNWVPQSSAGLRSKSRGFGLPLGRVEAEMVGNTPKNGLQANNYFRLHTDRCDVITLLCIRPAPAGGASRVCSSVRLHNTMVTEYPALCARLYQPFYRIWEGAKGYFDLPVWSIHKGKFTSQVSPSYIENAQVLSDVPRLDEEALEAVDILEEIGLRESVEFTMASGNVYWLNNHIVYHGRDSWRFNGSSEETKKGGDSGRLMLRMWLSPSNTRELPNTDRYHLVWGTTEGGKPRGGLEPALKSGLTDKRDELVNAVNKGDVEYYGLFKRKYGVDANGI